MACGTSSKFHFAIYVVGVFFVFTGSSALVAIQSSINIIGNTGPLSLTASDITAISYGMFLAPFIISACGARASLVGGEICYLLYVVANIFKRGVVRGVGNAIMWPSIAVLSAAYAKVYAEEMNKNEDQYLQIFTSMFFIVVHLNQVLGNAVSYLILEINPSMTSIAWNYTSPAMAIILNATTDTPIQDVEFDGNPKWRECARNDCQTESEIDDNIANYLPVSDTVRLMLLLAFIAVKLLGISINMFFSPGVLCLGRDVESEAKSMQYMAIQEESEVEIRTGCWYSIKTNLKMLFWQFFHPFQLAITPLTIYSGFLLSFVFNDLTRAYVSCLYGVSHVGIYMMIFGGTSAISAFVTGRIISNKFIVKQVSVLVVMLLDGVTMFLLYIWSPDKFTFLPYIAAVNLGLSSGILQPVILTSCLQYFERNRGLASTIWNCWTLAGMALCRVLVICVWKKIITMASLLGLGVICYGFGEWGFYRQQRNGI